MVDESVVGDLINFRGLVYAPLNENGVVFLFGKIMEDLNIYVEEIKPGFPDCIARRFTGKGWKRIRIEFEFQSNNFVVHKHDPAGCDIIVCWEHNWKTCPESLEVIELRDVITSLENYPIKRPDIQVPSEESPPFNISAEVQGLWNAVADYVKSLSEECVVTRVKLGYTIYSPERVFLYSYFRKSAVRLMLFTRGEEMEGVTPAESGVKKVGGQKWGYVMIASQKDLDKAKPIIARSLILIKETLANKEPTGYYAPLSDES